MMKIGTLAEVTAVNEGVLDKAKECGSAAANAVTGAPSKAYHFVKRGVNKIGDAYKRFNKKQEEYQKQAIHYGEDLKKFDDKWDKKNTKSTKAASK